MRWDHFTPLERVRSFAFAGVALLGILTGFLPLIIIGMAGVIYVAFTCSGPATIAERERLRRWLQKRKR